ncbi:MAG: hypothetical protein HY819_19360 [Acidobacteria bacterium]|nr:hypothetical protein [Acidobacteriota bacterium]
MEDKIQYVIVFIVVVIAIRLITNNMGKDRRSWQTIGQKYRLNFSQGVETRGDREVKVFRLKGYYRGCLVSITGSRSLGQAETHISISYPKGLTDSLRLYPDGTLARVGRGVSKMANSTRGSKQPFYLTMPPPKGMQQEVQKQLNPFIQEQLTQLFIICNGKGRRVDITDAYMIVKEVGFVKNIEVLIPLIDEVLTAINVLENNIGELLKDVTPKDVTPRI